MNTISLSTTPPSVSTNTLHTYFTDLHQQLIATANKKGMGTPSINLNNTDDGYELSGSIHFTEPGQWPIKPSAAGNPDMQQIITDWLDARGLNLNPAAGTIHESESRLYRSTGNADVISVSINPERLNRVFDEIGMQHLHNAADELFEAFTLM